MRIKDGVEQLIIDIRPEYSGGESPYYEYGRPTKIAALLSDKDDNDVLKYKKYPLVMLLQEFTEKRGGNLFESDVPVTIVIVTAADPAIISSDRDDENYNNVLYPIYYLFMEALRDSLLFDTSEELAHDLTESPYWGKEGQYGNTGNVMNDTLDALFIENLNLKLLKTC